MKNKKTNYILIPRSRIILQPEQIVKQLFKVNTNEKQKPIKKNK